MGNGDAPRLRLMDDCDVAVRLADDHQHCRATGDEGRGEAVDSRRLKKR